MKKNNKLMNAEEYLIELERRDKLTGNFYPITDSDRKNAFKDLTRMQHRSDTLNLFMLFISGLFAGIIISAFIL